MTSQVHASLVSLDQFEDEAYEFLEEILKEFNLEVELRRFKDSRYSGVGVTRVLIALRDELLNDNAKLIRFYQSCKRPSDDPHYEDLIIAILLSLITGVISSLAAQGLSSKFKARKRLDEKKVPELKGILDSNMSKDSLDALYYLLAAKIVRELGWRGELDPQLIASLLKQLEDVLEGGFEKLSLTIDKKERKKIDEYMKVKFKISQPSPQGIKDKLIEIVLKSSGK